MKLNYRNCISLIICLTLIYSDVLAQKTKKGEPKRQDVIIQVPDPNGWIIRTNSSSYQMFITPAGSLKLAFYGASAQADNKAKNAQWYEGIDEVPTRAFFPFRSPMLEVVYNDNVRDTELKYVSGEVITVDGRPTLKIVQKDPAYPLEVESFIRVLAEYDILEKWAVIKNTGTQANIKVENLQSGSIVLPPDEYILTHLAGKEMNEFQIQETLLTPGPKTIQNKSFKSNFNPPWFMVRPKGAEKNSGPAWFGSLHYSGNWEIGFDKSIDGFLQVMGGINFWDTSWNLTPGTSLETPKFTVGYTNGGPDLASQNLTAYIRNTILPPAHRKDMRPVLYNSWYSTFYAVNESQQLELAKTAKEIGVELFVIDDGWFKGRVSSATGLGDWEVDKTKFPNGLGPMIKQINDMGMDFGIWVEPESLVQNSETYKAHPEWMLQFPNRTGPATRRFLNLAREDVYQHLLQVFSKLLRENNIKFVKWDQNTHLSQPGWPDASPEMQREVRIRFINNLYRLVDELKKQFPNVWFESCASGGGRVDLGMLSRMDQAWVSDNVSPLDRLHIQYGYLHALPANTMVSWIADNTFHQPTSLDFKFDVSMSGVLGVGNDLRKWNDSDKAIAKKKIEEYKLIRPLVQQGKLFKLVSPFEKNSCALQYTDEKNTNTVVFCYNMAEYLNASQVASRESNVLKLKGLNAQATYTVKKIDERDKPGTSYTGDFLMNVGLAWPVKGANKSQIMLVTPR